MSFARALCAQCQGKGLIKVHYRSGEVSDVAICDCRAGDWWKKVGKRYIRHHLGLQKDQRIALARDFDEAPDLTQAQHDAAYHKGLMR